MFSYQVLRVAAAALGALILSTTFVAAAVGPATGVSTDAAATAYARIHTGSAANG
jgi:hypothetical protein